MAGVRVLTSFASAVALALFASVWSSAAQANVITYVASGTGSDGALSASATFTTGSGFIDINLTNTLALTSFVSVGQTISDLSFTLSNAPGTQGTLTAAGQEANISSTALVTDVSGTPGRFIGVGGGSFTVSGNTITLEAIGGSQPTELITPLETGSSFPDTNPGIDAHDPYTDGPAHFVLDFAGITAATNVTAATFSFGTGPDTFIAACNSDVTSCAPHIVVPEPLTLSLFGAGLVGVAAMRRRKKAKA
jgi:hypothetical protein